MFRGLDKYYTGTHVENAAVGADINEQPLHMP